MSQQFEYKWHDERGIIERNPQSPMNLANPANVNYHYHDCRCGCIKLKDKVAALEYELQQLKLSLKKPLNCEIRVIPNENEVTYV